MIAGNEGKQIIISGYDFAEFVLQCETVPLVKPNWGEIPDLPDLEIVLRSDSYQFHPNFPTSPFFGERTGQKVEVREFGRSQWIGSVTNVKAPFGDRRVYLECESALSQKINFKGRLDATAATPSENIGRLCELYSIPTDPESFSRATALLNDIPVLVRVYPGILDWTGTVGDLLKLLCSAGVGRLYLTSEGTLGFDTFYADPNPIISATITDQWLAEYPGVETEDSEPQSGYSVEFLYGTESLEGSDNLQTMDFGPNSAVQLTSQAGAIYVGTQWLDLSNRDYLLFTLSIFNDYALLLRIGAYVRIESDIMQTYITGEIIGIDVADIRYTKVTVRAEKV